jgi:rhodanese-related sulfurtransferase
MPEPIAAEPFGEGLLLPLHGRALSTTVRPFFFQNSASMYKGDISPQEAFDRLSADPRAVVLDVRTAPEWVFVGVPDVERLVRVSWQVFPTMEINARFVEMVREEGVSPDMQVLCLCRSGSRSAHAAQALTAAGFENCYNIAEGFEGHRDMEGHRGAVNGWKAVGLPWVQN